MKIFKLLTLALGILTAPSLFAHEGHEHAPGAINAPHGGVVKMGKEIALEFVQADGKLKIYPLTHELKAIPLTDIKLQGKAQPAKKSKVDMSFTAEGEFYTASYKGQSYKTDLDITANYKGKTDSIRQTIETQE